MPIPNLPATAGLDAALGAAVGQSLAGTLGAGVAQAGTPQAPFSGQTLVATGVQSGIDGTPLFSVVGPDGKVANRVSLSQIESRLLLWKRENGMSDEEFSKVVGSNPGWKGFSFANGGLSYSGTSSTGKAVDYQRGTDGRATTFVDGRETVQNRPVPGGRTLQGGGGGGGGAGGGGGMSGPPAPTTGRQYTGGSSQPAQPPRETTTTLTPGTEPGGPTQIDPNAPLGLDPSRGASPGPRGGDPLFRNSVFPGPGSVLEGIGPNSTLNDVILNIVRRQEANRDAASGIYGGAYRSWQQDPVLQASRGTALDVLNNPFSLDDQTVERILGKQGDLIGQNYARLQGQAADKAAASGTTRSGVAQDAQSRLQINAVRDLGDAQRNLLVEQATRRPQELQAALGAGGSFGARDVAQGTGIATGAADSIHGQTSIMGDALLSGVLMGGGPPPIRVGNEYQQGAIGSRYGYLPPGYW